MAISYQITPFPERHVYKVSLTFVATGASQLIKLPTWIPGSYMIREFSRQIITIAAKQGANEIWVEQLNKNSWQLSLLNIGEMVEVSYEVYAYEYGIRTAFLDLNRGYFNPTSLCLAVVGCENSRHSISFASLPANWEVASGLEKNFNGIFVATNYDELLDCPFELGVFTRFKFEVGKIAHYLILSGTILPFDEKRILNDMSKICEYQIKMFGGKAPYKDYTFILNLSGEIFTGLEHRNSTLLMAPNYSLPNKQGTNDEDYLKLMGLISHEFFHTWNVKRIKPKVFVPYNLDQENYTKLLWWFEGVTSYYDDLVLYRAGVISREKYLGLVVDNFNNVYKYAGANKQSIANSSLTSWIKYYRQDENSPNSIVSYYVKGSLVAMCLDLLIREKSQYSLDNVLLRLYDNWCANPVGVAEDEIPHVIKSVTGLDLSEFINLATETTKMLPFQELFKSFGLRLINRTAKNHLDNGKFYPELPLSDASKAKSTLDMGVKLEKSNIGYTIKNVFADTPAEEVGLAAGDIIIAINQVKLTNIDKQLSFYPEGAIVQLAVFRQDKLLNIPLTLSPCKVQLFELALEDSSLITKWL